MDPFNDVFPRKNYHQQNNNPSFPFFTSFCRELQTMAGAMGGNEEIHAQNEEEEEEMQGFIELWKRMFAFMDSLGLRWAVEMEIPDMLSTGPLSAEEIASHLPSQAPNMAFLCRILSFLTTRGILSQTISHTQVKYALTPLSKWLVKNRPEGDSMNSMVLMQTHQAVITPWYRFRDCVLGGGFPFEVVHGEPLFAFAQGNPDFGRLFNDAMASHSKMLMKHILSAYSEGFKGLTSLVDVGGGKGFTLSKVAEAFPNIKCYNFDLPQVIQDAPTFAGVEHVAGDMFVNVPEADAILIKLILHDWDDEKCVKILQNCKKSIGEGGKVIIVDTVLGDPCKEKKSGYEEIGGMMDMVMLAHQRGKERSEAQWRELLNACGFPRYNIIPLPSQMSIIEAFPCI